MSHSLFIPFYGQTDEKVAECLNAMTEAKHYVPADALIDKYDSTPNAAGIALSHMVYLNADSWQQMSRIRRSKTLRDIYFKYVTGEGHRPARGYYVGTPYFRDDVADESDHNPDHEESDDD